MSPVSIRLQAVIKALQNACALQDRDKFSSLDDALHAILNDCRTNDSVPSPQQLEVLRKLYTTMRDQCQQQKQQLSQELSSMRQQRTSIDAYANCLAHGGE